MKKILFSLLALASPFLVTAQHGWARPYWEVGILGGVSNYSGELVNSIVDVKHTHLAGAIFGRYNMNKYLTFRLQVALGTISGNDKDSKQDRNVVRNLHFRSPLTEVGIIGEFNLMGYNPVGHGKMFSPYAFLGISIFNFNPKAKHFDVLRRGDEWVDLQPLNTEGQGLSNFPNRKPYSRTQVSFPLGLGFKFAVHSNMNIGFEIGFRATRTDYLDDVGTNYAYDPLVDPDGYLYDQTPFRDGDYLLVDNVYDADGILVSSTPIRSLSFQELMADGTYLYLMKTDDNGVNTVDKELYDQTVQTRRQGYNLRGGGTKGLDSYLIAGLTISYNITDEGLAGARQRRKRRAGCKSAQF
jgi:opacity protein-like surface antigen